MKRFLIMLMVLGLVSGSVATAEAEERFERADRTVVASYYGSQLLIGSSCGVSGAAGCINIETLPGEDSLNVVVTDAHGQPVHGWVSDASEAHDPRDAEKFYGGFCGQTTKPISFEPGTKLELHVGTWWPTWSGFIPTGVGCFPGVATTGTISATLTGWTTSDEPASPSPEPSSSPAPESSPSGEPEVVERSVDLALSRHLRGVGSVVAAAGSCRSDVPVVVQRMRFDAWLDIASTTTDADGEFAVRLTDRSGRYRAIASEVASSEGTCLGATSPVARHRH